MISLGEVVDKITILELKISKGTLTSKQVSKCKEELTQLSQALKETDDDDEFSYFKAMLKKINNTIFDLEKDLRTGSTITPSNAELQTIKGLSTKQKEQVLIIGLRAKQIRDINRKRVAWKNKITKIYDKHGFTDVKTCHASENKK